MAHEALNKRFLHVTSIEIGPNAHHVVARCDLCNLVAERRVDDWKSEGVLDVIAIEALAQLGCTHVNEVIGSGVRRAFSRRS